MFVETITSPRDEWERWRERLTLDEKPPAGLVASIAWHAGEGAVTVLNLWDSPDSVAEFYVDRVHGLVQELGEPAGKPERHGQPLAVFLRP